MDQRGVALPLALLVVMLLLSLMIALIAAVATETGVSKNHALHTQGRALAESGVERAIWALNNPTSANGIPNPISGGTAGAAAPAPYDGSTFIQVSSFGGFYVTVRNTNPAAAGQRDITATGWAPTSGPGGASGHVKLLAQVTQLPQIANNALCVVCARGNFSVSGGASIDATADTSCGSKYASFTTGITTYTGAASATSPNKPPYVQTQPTPAFDVFALTTANMNTLRALGKQNGTYWQGTVALSNLPNGIIFVDTVDGTNALPGVNATNLAQVALSSSCCTDPAGFHGWLIAQGSISISGTGTYNGLIYAADNVSISDSPIINGLIIAKNVTGSGQSQVNVSGLGGARLKLNCANANGGGLVPRSWLLQVGTYQEVMD